MNAIINYLEIALEGSLDQETRDNLAKSHSASKSLIYVINDLLDLTKTEEGQDLIKDEVFDLHETINEATESFRGDAKRKGLEFGVVEHPGLPTHVYGDQRRVRQAISNITANAVQHTTIGRIDVEAYLQDITDNRATVEIVVQDTGEGMSDEKLDNLFRDLEQVTTDEWGIDTSNTPDKSLTDGKQSRTLGLGLAMVARIIRAMDGQLRLKSEEGKGSRFVIQVPFSLPEDVDDGASDMQSGAKLLTSSNQSVVSQPNQQTDGEVTLVEKSSIRSGGVSHKRSVEEITSLRSFKSGSSQKTDQSSKSDVDRMIDALSTPFPGGDGQSDKGHVLQRTNSRGSKQSQKSTSSWSNANEKRNSISAQERPGTLRRSRSHGTQEHLRSPQEGPAGSEFVQDNKTLLRAIRMPDEFSEQPTTDAHPHTASKVLFNLPNKQDALPSPSDQAEAEVEALNAEHLQVLVAEDDPVNSRIIKKRLEKSGHIVHHSNNGEECATAFAENPVLFDVVLMDMQVSYFSSSHSSLHPDSALFGCPCFEK